MDAGKRLVDHIYQAMSIDEEWSTRTDRGFSWWGGPLKQSIWADDPIEDLGLRVSRVHARTDVLTGVTASPKTIALIGATAGFSTLNGPILADGLLQSAASVFVHDQTLSQWRTVFSVAALLQVASAHIEAESMASLTGVEVARSVHPQSGERSELDPILDGIRDIVAPAGQEPSKFIGDDFEEAERTFGAKISVLTTASSTGLTSEFPFGDETALFSMKTEQSNPRLGNGMLATLTLPIVFSAEEVPSLILDLNRREVNGESRAAFLGSWCANPSLKGCLTYVAFYPNLCYMPGLPINILMHAAGRARWAQDHFSGAMPARGSNQPEPAFVRMGRMFRRLIGR